ncbi:hypothetical protein BABINDRAFT_160392 [Babjeviella inositovora NRRL Y-12698]|uniref:Pheromone-regulated membrane protein 10 n=1 Tax=Babjeviella inositovora NRRL Y-12698 TaxID=984486 RepID=A0A1E3QTG3_9ASCO|nr:uncharacterized protein BABINDRAFT_160392 [Babjeviella inositovora NRRL Y-12698]ODQ80958.1 hypothetical protein BABINDRAFT_160392 [Babjeviella inositovora NRRL Y-12698]
MELVYSASSDEEQPRSNVRLATLNFSKPNKKDIKELKRNIHRREALVPLDSLVDPLGVSPEINENFTYIEDSSFDTDSERQLMPQFTKPEGGRKFEQDMEDDFDTEFRSTEITDDREAPLNYYDSSEDVSTEEDMDQPQELPSRHNLRISTDVTDMKRRASLRDKFMTKFHLAKPETAPLETLLGNVMHVGSVGGLTPSNDPENGQVSGETLEAEVKDIMDSHAIHLQVSNVSTSSTFLAPNPDYYLRHELDDEYDIYSDHETNHVEGYIPPPRRVQAGVLSSLLKLYQNPHEAKSSQTLLTPVTSQAVSETRGLSRLRQRFRKHGSLVSFNQDDLTRKFSQEELTRKFSQDRISDESDEAERLKKVKPHKRSRSEMFGLKKQENNSADALPTFKPAHKPRAPKPRATLLKRKHLETQAKITVHIADILQRQRFILRMCRALMLYGAPTHRLEEYMTMTSRVLEIDGQFIYFPGCMIVSFGDATTRTSEMHLVRCSQGLDLSRLADVHKIYKAVVHDLLGVDDALTQLDEILARTPRYPPWVLVLNYAFALAFVAPWSFGGTWVDMPMCFWIGLLVGILQNYVSPRCNLYLNVFEICASILISFCARAIGSVNGGNTFCFSAIAQGSLALILPGYMVLCGSLELQTRNTVSGAVRMFYAIIYFLFLGFGITLGAALYGWIDSNAVSEVTCKRNLSPWWNFLFVPMFTIGLGLLSQAKWLQLPVMVLILGAGTTASYFSNLHFSDVTEFSSAIGVFVIGVLGNLYSRLGKGMAVLAMLPGIMCQLPGGIGAKSTLLAGVATANKIVNGTSTDGTSSLSFGVTLIEITIGITVGLFAATLVVYPFGKRSTGLFTL